MAKKAFIIAAGLVLLLIPPFSIVPTIPAAASADTVNWSRVDIPTGGEAGGWVLASGSDLQHLTMAVDGTLYAYGKSLTYTLYKSTNGGYSWSYIGNVQHNIVDIATSPADAEMVYYATSANVYRSTDGGKTFSSLPPNPGGAGSDNIEITSIDVACLSSNIIIVGTRDTDNGQFGGVYTLDDSPFIPSWTDTNIGNYDVYAVAVSPNFSTDRQFVAVATDETDTYVTTKLGDTGWGAAVGNARLDKDDSGTPTPVAVAASAAIAFPGDYSSDATEAEYIQFIAIDTGTGNGDVYKIRGAEAPENPIATDLNVGSAYGSDNIDVTGLAVAGDASSANIIAGAADSAQTYFSSDGGSSWDRSRKEPTGGSATYVLMAEDFSDSGKAYAATSGDESAFSISLDSGVIWNQTGLIDTGISTIVDLAPSPTYSQDNTLFMLTFGSEHSLWRSLDSGAIWERVFSSTLANVDSVALVELSSQYGNGSQVVFLAGSSNSRPVIWKSSNNGQRFLCQPALDPTTSAQLSIDTWAVVDDTALFIGSYDGTNGKVYRTANGGFSYSTGALAGSQQLHSIVLSPSYEQDETILTGNTNGWVYWSDDNGASFKPLPPDATTPPLTDSITVAFDPAFDSNNTVYAASNTADKGVYRFVIGTSTTWESIDSTLPTGGMLNQVVVARDGTLYAANAQAGDGAERSLNPTYSLGPSFESVSRGLSDTATLSGLWLRGDRLWSIDTTDIKLMTIAGGLTLAVTPTSPASEGAGIGTLTNHAISNVRIDWETLEGATSYQWQLDYDTDFSSVPSGFEGSTKASSARLPTLEPATTYYWRVRATAPALSPWSAKWSFTTSLDTEAIAFKLESPKAGAGEVSIRPIFQWSAVAGADAYELLVSADVHFDSPAIVKIADYALPSSAWQSDVSLDDDTTYYWKVRAISPDTRSSWSAIGAFTTEAAPAAPTPSLPAPEPYPSLALPAPPMAPPASVLAAPPTRYSTTPAPITEVLPPPPPPMPAPLPPSTSPGWTPYLIFALFLVIILLLVIVLVLAAGTRRI